MSKKECGGDGRNRVEWSLKRAGDNLRLCVEEEREGNPIASIQIERDEQEQEGCSCCYPLCTAQHRDLNAPRGPAFYYNIIECGHRLTSIIFSRHTAHTRKFGNKIKVRSFKSLEAVCRTPPNPVNQKSPPPHSLFFKSL
jgi:hypothetical protein